MTRLPERFFDPDLAARLSRAELTVQRIVDGFLAGKNRSSRHGYSVEFVEHREYAPGDDLRHLDWKVLGRMDRYYIKRYEEETNITAVLLVDSSASMHYSGPEAGGRTKFEAAATAAAALGYLLNRQRDAVALALFDEELRAYVPPSVRLTSLANIITRLSETVPQKKSTLRPVIERLTPELPGRCLFILVSDFFVPTEEVEATLRLLRFQGHDVLALHVLDRAEKEFPFRTNMLFRGLEDDRRLLAEPQRLRTQYLAAMDEFITRVRKACEENAFDYELLVGGEPLGAALAALLAARARRKRVTQRGRS